MKLGTISKILDYYTTHERYSPDLERALQEFFGTNLPPEEEYLQYFNEWLIYDFILASGKTVLQDFYERNPFKLKPEKLIVYSQLLNTHVYGMFEVTKIDLNRGLELVNLATGKTYYVFEKSATQQLEVGNQLFGRVAQVDDHWELVGANSLRYDFKLQDGMRQYLRNAKDADVVNSKTTYELLKSSLEPTTKTEPAVLDPTIVEVQVQQSLQDCTIDQFITLTIIKQWISQLKKDEDQNFIFSVLAGLCVERASTNQLKQLIQSVQNLYNVTKQKRLHNQSPQQRKLAAPQSFGSKGISMQATKLGEFTWMELYPEVFNFMKQLKFREALDKLNECFQTLLQEQTTIDDIYRLYANKAVAHFNCGETELGEQFLNIALTLNPNYDFAQTVSKQYHQGDLDDNILRGKLLTMQQAMESGDHPLARWDFDAMRNDWSTEKIVSQLADVNINVTQADFARKAKRYISIAEFADKELEPYYQGKEIDKDIILIGAEILWERWCPQLYTTDRFAELIEELEAVIDTKKRSSARLKAILEQLTLYAQVAPAQIFAIEYQHGLGAANIMNLLELLLNLIGTNFEQMSVQLGQQLAQRFHCAMFELIQVCSDIVQQRDWKTAFTKITESCSQYIEPYMYVARTLQNSGNATLAETYLQQAYSIVQQRELDKCYDLPLNRATLYDDYFWVFKSLLECYKKLSDTIGIQTVKKLQRQLKKRHVELLFSPRAEASEKNLEQHIASHLKKCLADDPASKYYVWLQKLHINFATATLTYTPQISLGTTQTQQPKTGRNEPCSCGSGKKYKKCCLN